MALLEVDAGNARVEHLAEELAEVGAPLMPHPGIGQQGGLVACLDDAI